MLMAIDLTCCPNCELVGRGTGTFVGGFGFEFEFEGGQTNSHLGPVRPTYEPFWQSIASIVQYTGAGDGTGDGVGDGEGVGAGVGDGVGVGAGEGEGERDGAVTTFESSVTAVWASARPFNRAPVLTTIAVWSKILPLNVAPVPIVV
jgi:hypothetical protein